MRFQIRSVCVVYLLITIFPFKTYGQNNISGKYADKYGKLELNCDGSFNSVYFIDKDTIAGFGKWSQVKNKLIFIVDSSWSTIKMERNKEFILEIKDSSLYGSKITRADYRKMKRLKKGMWICLPQKKESLAEYKAIRQKLNKVSSFDCL